MSNVCSPSRYLIMLTPKNSHSGVSRCQFKAQDHDALAHFIGEQTGRKKVWGKGMFAVIGAGTPLDIN